jgi:hypothetical protein
MSQTSAVAVERELEDATWEKIMADKTYAYVLRTLAQRKSMPFLELTSLCNLREDKLSDIIRDLEFEDVVKVNYRGDITEEIVTLKHKGFGLLSSLVD